MWNVKTLGMFKTMWQLLVTAQFASNLSANIYLLLAIYTLPYSISRFPSFFLVDFEQVFYEIFLLENLCLTFL